jgi:hypothetical protein
MYHSLRGRYHTRHQHHSVEITLSWIHTLKCIIHWEDDITHAINNTAWDHSQLNPHPKMYHSLRGRYHTRHQHHSVEITLWAESTAQHVSFTERKISQRHQPQRWDHYPPNHPHTNTSRNFNFVTLNSRTSNGTEPLIPEPIMRLNL